MAQQLTLYTLPGDAAKVGKCYLSTGHTRASQQMTFVASAAPGALGTDLDITPADIVAATALHGPLNPVTRIAWVGHGRPGSLSGSGAMGGAGGTYINLNSILAIIFAIRPIVVNITSCEFGKLGGMARPPFRHVNGLLYMANQILAHFGAAGPNMALNANTLKSNVFSGEFIHGRDYGKRHYVIDFAGNQVIANPTFAQYTGIPL